MEFCFGQIIHLCLSHLDHREREAESWPEFEREKSFRRRERWPGGEKAERRWSKG
ncbi:hypothetical protein HID58_091484 [Brassica napus]|uniref:Uncharacterized protein n=1 Tax=Brassica napus TaxID=3708 RepID=A0ABQ7WZT1_BRANA|nr:hypothetical protein HID58_091484 [Brassica napus]